MTNKELAKSNYYAYSNAFFAFEDGLIVLCQNFDFGYKRDTGLYNKIHESNIENNGFVVLQYLVDRKIGIKNFIDLDNRVKHKFGFENPITMICDHNFDGGGFSLVFRQAFFIGKDGLLHTFDNLESLTNKIRQIVYE